MSDLPPDEPIPYDGPERRSECRTPENCANLVDVERRFTDGTARMKRIEDSISDLKDAHTRFEEKLDANTATTEQNAANNAKILDILQLGESFFRIAGYFGVFMKWLSTIAVACAGLWYVFVHGKPPP